jgi:NAD(P)H-flavin reductase
MGYDKALKLVGQAKTFALYEGELESPVRKTSAHDLKLNIELPCSNTEFKAGQFVMLRWGAHIVGRPYTIIAHKKKSAQSSGLQLWARPTEGPTRELWSLSRGQRLWVTLPLGRGIEETLVERHGAEVLNQPMLFLSEGPLSAAVWAYFELRRKSRLVLGSDQQDFWMHREPSQDFVDAELMSRSYARPDQVVIGSDWAATDLDLKKSRYASAVCALSEASFAQVVNRVPSAHLVRANPRMACGLGLCYSCTVVCEGQARRACLEGPWFSSFEVPSGR